MKDLKHTDNVSNCTAIWAKLPPLKVLSVLWGDWVTDVKNTSNNTSNKVTEYLFVFELEGEVFATFDHEDKGCNSYILNCDTLYIYTYSFSSFLSRNIVIIIYREKCFVSIYIILLTLCTDTEHFSHAVLKTNSADIKWNERIHSLQTVCVSYLVHLFQCTECGLAL